MFEPTINYPMNFTNLRALDYHFKQYNKTLHHAICY